MPAEKTMTQQCVDTNREGIHCCDMHVPYTKHIYGMAATIGAGWFFYQQLDVKLLGEESLSSDLRQGLVQNHVPRRLDHLTNQSNTVVGASSVPCHTYASTAEGRKERGEKEKKTPAQQTAVMVGFYLTFLLRDQPWLELSQLSPKGVYWRPK